MAKTPHLNLPYISAAQAQKHVTHNEALRALDAIVHLSVLDRDLSTPPTSPNEGDRFLVASNAIGDWSGQDHSVAAFQDGAWIFYTPNTGWLAWIVDEAILVGWDGSNWVVSSGSSGGGTSTNLNPATGGLVGVNATADPTNRLSVNSPASLFNHEGGDHQVKVNKNTNTDTASVLFQTGFSGRAEFGLTGDDDFHMKVSPDGNTFHEGLVINKDDGVASIKGLRHIDTGVTLSSVVFTPGGDGEVSMYRNNTTVGQNPRSATISSISSDTITLTTSEAGTIFENIMEGVSYIRIWNTSKSPEQSAWVMAKPSAAQLQVTDSSHISGWNNADTIQVGDPTSVISTRVMTLDISPMLTNLFGTSFRQTGIIVKSALLGASAGDNISISPTGLSGSFSASAIFGAGDGNTIIPCTDLSPISTSNLVRIRETISSTAEVRLVSSIGVFL
ncbi:MAG: DUF2793 domain-containing protein [Hyphomicrobiales bacterium]